MMKQGWSHRIVASSHGHIARDDVTSSALLFAKLLVWTVSCAQSVAHVLADHSSAEHARCGGETSGQFCTPFRFAKILYMLLFRGSFCNVQLFQRQYPTEIAQVECSMVIYTYLHPRLLSTRPQLCLHQVANFGRAPLPTYYIGLMSKFAVYRLQFETETSIRKHHPFSREK